MITNYIRKHFHQFVIYGIILQCISGLILPARDYRQDHVILTILGWLFLLSGTILLLIGFAFYAKAKGRHPAWSLLALLSIIGWLILILLRDKNPSLLHKENSERTGFVQ